jgi:hypothetical protein
MWDAQGMCFTSHQNVRIVCQIDTPGIFRGFYNTFITTRPTPHMLWGPAWFVKPTRRLFFVILLTYAFSVSTRIKAVTIRACIESARVSHYLPHSLKSATISRHIMRPRYRAGTIRANCTSVVSSLFITNTPHMSPCHLCQTLLAQETRNLYST